MRLSIIIVNYRTADLTIDCLRSLAPQMQEGWSVIITDNLSGDDSVSRLDDAIGQNGWTWARTMPLSRNGGFAYGNNVAIRALNLDSHDYVLLLNPDTVVREGAIQALLDYMNANPKAGIAGSRLEDPDGTPQASAFRFHSIASEFERGMRLGLVSKLLARSVVAQPIPEVDSETDWVAGASMIVRPQVFLDVARASCPGAHGQDALATEIGMDEKYFMYFEEVDFCLAARRAGWKIAYAPKSRVVHLVGAASQLSDARKHRKRRPAYWFDSRRRYFVKNHGVLYACAADAAFAIGFAIWRARRALQRKADPDPPQMLGDFVRNSIFVRGATL